MNLDLIHTHGSKTSSIINLIRKLINIKHVATAHGIKKKTTPFLKADRLIAVSSKIQDSIQRDSIKINNWWSPILPSNIDRKSNYVIAIGRLEKVKGFDLLIESWKNISSNLIIIGSGKEHSHLTQLIINLGLDDRIQIINEVSQKKLIEYYQQALELNSRLPQALNNIAVNYHYQGSKASEKKEFELAQNLFEKASTYWKKAIRLAPNNYIEAQNWLKITGKLSDTETF